MYPRVHGSGQPETLPPHPLRTISFFLTTVTKIVEAQKCAVLKL